MSNIDDITEIKLSDFILTFDGVYAIAIFDLYSHLGCVSGNPRLVLGSRADIDFVKFKLVE
ncbi:MAG: hypothetical protein U0V72_01430 [Cytophagales bacterium]